MDTRGGGARAWGTLPHSHRTLSRLQLCVQRNLIDNLILTHTGPVCPLGLHVGHLGVAPLTLCHTTAIPRGLLCSGVAESPGIHLPGLPTPPNTIGVVLRPCPEGALRAREATPNLPSAQKAENHRVQFLTRSNALSRTVPIAQ